MVPRSELEREQTHVYRMRMLGGVFEYVSLPI